MTNDASTCALRGALVALTLGLAACSAPPATDAGPDATRADATTDAATDVAADATIDAGEDATSADARDDRAPDVALDAPADAAADAGEDVAVDGAADVAIDTAADVAADASGDAPADVACTGGAALCRGACVPSGGLTHLDVSGLFDVDVILNNGSGSLDPTQDPIDGSNYVALTQAAASALGGPSAAGLPNDGRFAADASHPEIQLAYRDGDDGNNAARVRPGTPLTLDVPDRPYAQLHVLGLSTEGDSPLTFTLRYCDGTTTTRTVSFPDWFADPPPAGIYYLIDGMDRAGTAGTGYQAARDPAVFGVNLSPDATRVLLSVEIAVAPASTARFFLLGATAQ